MEIPIRSFKGIYSVLTNEILIVQYDDLDKKVWIPSFLTNFIYHKYNNCSINTKVKVARNICAFIDYVNNQVVLGEDKTFERLKDSGLYGINYISNKRGSSNSYDIVKQKEKYLFKFYRFLYSRGITSEAAKINMKIVSSSEPNSGGHYVEMSPFEDNSEITIEYPSKRKIPSRILKDMEVDVWNRFLEFAEEHYPNIALGVALQFMGGLRLGEVVNLVISAVTLCREQRYMKVDIMDRQDELFGDRDIKMTKSQNKKIRFDQTVFNFNSELFEMYERHLKRLANNPKITNRNALLVNSFGEPMTGESYSRYFTNLKNDFIEYISSEGYITVADDLIKHDWNTHIGRHVFTNYLIKIGAVNDATSAPVARYLMVLRGDSSEKSSLTYIDVKAVIDVVIDKLDLISRVASSVNGIGRIMND
ncbi:site-specific integrase [Clostridium botulinum]|nr:site-specific integrase [Clostridium botulinum]